MKAKAIALLALASLTLSSCMVTSGSRDVTYKFRPSYTNTSNKDLTFSVQFTNTLGGDSSYQPEKLIKTIQSKLMDTGMYRSVTYTPHTRSADHYVFTINVHGISKSQRAALGFVHGLTLFTLPVWFTQEMDVRLDVDHGGKTLAMATDQYARTYMWAPFIFAAPFANSSTATENTVERFIAFFCSEIKQRGLHL